MANSLAPTWDLWRGMTYLGEPERHDGQVGTVMAEFCLQCIPGEAWAQVELPQPATVPPWYWLVLGGKWLSADTRQTGASQVCWCLR